MASKSRLNTTWSALLSRHPHLEALIDDLRPWLPPLNFVTLHYIYFVLLSLLFSVVFWISSDVEDREDVSYVDSLFLVVSAVTNTGLNTVDLSALTGGQQGMLWVLMTLGSAMWVSFWTVLVRRHKRVERMRLARVRKGLDGGFALADLRGGGGGGYGLGGLGQGRRRERGSSGATTLSSVVDVPPMILRKIMSKEKEKVDEEPDVGAGGLASGVGSGVSVADGHGSLTAMLHHSGSTGEDKSHHHSHSHVHFHPSPFDNPSDDSSSRPSSGPRAWFNFRKLFPVKKDKQDGDRDPASQLLLLESTAAAGPGSESERLAQRDHQALNLLALIIPLYAVLWVLVSALILGAWISRHYASAVEEYGGYGVGAWWAGFFYAGSAFNNCGMSLLDANLVPFQHSFLVLFLLASLILAGNTAFPAFLRLMVWCMLEGLKLLTPERLFVAEKATLLYILKYPRQVYTHLFPARQTWLLVGMLVATMTIDWVAFEVLSIGNPAVERIPVGPRILDGLFQAISVRGTGFYVVPVSELYTSLQVLYMVMMYISAYPIVIAMRHSNVSEERSGALAMHAKFDAVSSSSSSSATSDDPELGRLLPSSSSQPQDLVLTSPTATATHDNPLQTALRRFASILSARPRRNRDHHTSSRPSILGQKIRRQLLHDLWVLSASTILITLLEIYAPHASDSDPMDHGDYHRPPVNPFHVAFEVVSAYGCVGMSVGLERASVSLAGGWAVASRLVLVGVMLKGRHRGLWVVLDRVTGVGGDGGDGDEDEEEEEGFEEN